MMYFCSMELILAALYDDLIEKYDVVGCYYGTSFLLYNGECSNYVEVLAFEQELWCCNPTDLDEYKPTMRLDYFDPRFLEKIYEHLDKYFVDRSVF